MRRSKSKRDVLNRYERAADGSFLIDIAATRVEDLYNNFDRSAPYIRRDLDADLVDYVILCAKELGHESFAIRFNLTDRPDDHRLARIRHSVHRYFQYLAETERQDIYRMMRRSAVLFCIGVAILIIAVWVSQMVGPRRLVVGSVFAEGLTVAAWVSLWEALATFLIEWFPHRKDLCLYERLAEAPLIFD